jgi:hypothetical protein
MIRIAATPAASVEQTSPTVETIASIAEISGAILMQRPSGEQEMPVESGVRSCWMRRRFCYRNPHGGANFSHWFKQQKLEDAHG